MQAGKHGAATGYAPPVPKLRLVPALNAFLLALLFAITFHLSKSDGPYSPRPGADPSSPSGAALGVALLLLGEYLLWIAYSVWRNLHGFRAWGPIRTVLCGLHIVLQPVYWIFGVVMLMLIVSPVCHDCTVRSHNALMVGLASNLENPVTNRAQANGTLTGSGAGIEVNPDRWITAGLVGRDGAVITYNGRLRMLAVLLPEMRRDRVTWSCKGMPPKYFSRFEFCRDANGETSFALRDSGSPREDALALLEQATVWQRQVESSAPAHGTLEASVPTTIAWRQGLADFALLDSNGRMALYSDRHGTFALLEPRLESGKVAWRCRVWPATAATPGCAPGR